MSNARLMKPLFYDGNFNRDGKKMRAVFEREISDGTVSYRLWRSDGKPDIQYPRAENDNYLLYAEIRDYLVPLRITDFYLIDHAGYPAAVAELYGNKDARNDYFDNLRKSGDDAVLEAVRRERERIMLLAATQLAKHPTSRSCLTTMLRVLGHPKKTEAKVSQIMSVP